MRKCSTYLIQGNFNAACGKRKLLKLEYYGITTVIILQDIGQSCILSIYMMLSFIYEHSPYRASAIR